MEYQILSGNTLGQANYVKGALYMRLRGGKKSTGKSKRTEKLMCQSSLLQLLFCIILFLSVYIGKGLMPGQMASHVGEQLVTMITADIDFASALAELGDSLSEDKSVLRGFGDFCVAVFGSGTPEGASQQTSASSGYQYRPIILKTELEFLNSDPPAEQLRHHYLYGVHNTKLMNFKADQTSAYVEIPLDMQEPETVPAVGTVLFYADYSGDPPPKNCTMDQISLGLLDTIVPVNGEITSSYGYRNHPISGDYQFHTGVDIAGDVGDTIAAFSAGTVEYVGEDDSYGLYFQLDHGNGVKSFYAHCDSVCITKGETVEMGETVGKVGATGTVTGPHLHFEVKFHKLRLNPAYYLELP